MGFLRNFVTELHQSTSRDYLARMIDSKVEAMKIAKRYDFDYWDGERKFGYGGYKYLPGRWAPVARQLISTYGLSHGGKILDIGCGKGYLLYEMQKIQPKLEIYGLDISQYALSNIHPDLQGVFQVGRAQDPLPFDDQAFDLAISIGTFHNLHIHELAIALPEMTRVAKSGYLMVESFRNEQEMFNLECWALTAESLMDVDEWIWIFERFGYTGDFEFIFFE